MSGKLDSKMVLSFFLLFLFLLIITPKNQLKTSTRIERIIEKIKKEGEKSYIGVVMAYSTEQLALENSGSFVPNSRLPWIDWSGRRFNIGKIKGADVIHVMMGEKTLNAGITVQMLVDLFDIKGIVHYGTAGSANDSLSIGDVSVPNYVAFTGSWKWKESDSEEGKLTELKFGAYNSPVKGENLLGKIEFTPQELYSTGKPMEEVFWLPVEPKWFKLACNKLQDVKLQDCVNVSINETYCLPKKPNVVFGLNASSADILLNNAAYRKFLFSNFNVSTVDEESFAVVMTCITNGVPCIVFRGAADLAGGDKKPVGTKILSTLASANALTVAIEFIGHITTTVGSTPLPRRRIRPHHVPAHLDIYTTR